MATFINLNVKITSVSILQGQGLMVTGNDDKTLRVRNNNKKKTWLNDMNIFFFCSGMGYFKFNGLTSLISVACHSCPSPHSSCQLENVHFNIQLKYVTVHFYTNNYY